MLNANKTVVIALLEALSIVNCMIESTTICASTTKSRLHIYQNFIFSLNCSGNTTKVFFFNF